MDSARSHLKDYIREGRNERGGKDLSPSRLLRFLLPFMISPTVPPLPPQRGWGGGNFELVFDDDASPARAVALFYRRLRDRDIDWDSRNSAKGSPIVNRWNEICVEGAGGRGVGEFGIPTTFQVVGSRSRICPRIRPILSITDKKEESLVGWGREHDDILYINSKFMRKSESAVAEIKHVSAVIGNWN